MESTSRYIWSTGKGELIVSLDQPITFKLVKDQNTTLITHTEGLPLNTPLEKIEEVFIRYLPIIKNTSVTFHEAVISQGEPQLIKEKPNKNFSFNFNQLENVRKVAFAKKEDKSSLYLRVIRGLNMQGECGNSKCLAHKKVVMVPIGYGKQNIGILRSTLKCPACDYTINKEKVTNLGFWDCHYIIEGLRKGETDIIKKEEVAPHDHFRTFQNDEDCEWEGLDVIALEVGKKTVESSSTCQLL